MTNEELLIIIRDLESDRVERTTSTKDLDKFAKNICSFSNDFPNHLKPGYLLIGVKDKTSELSGLELTDKLLKDLASIRDTGNIQPLPSITVQKHSFVDGDVAVVETSPSLLPPVRYKGQVWIRVGPTCRIATELDEQNLSEKRISHAVTFDARPCLGCEIEELSRELFLITYLPNAVSHDIIEQNNRNWINQLNSLRFYDLKHSCPTNAGILLFAEDPLRWLPGAYIQFVRFNGESITDEVIDEKQFSGDLLNVLKNIAQFILLQIQQHPEFENILKERAVLSYPERAIRELLMNAVMHRNYEGSTSPIRLNWFSNRIEIHSPGGLFGEVTPDNYMRQTSYRNPVVAEAMKELGYVNRFGIGIQQAQKSLKENNNPPAEFEFEQNYVLVTIWKQS